ncbi:hypothetical protein KDJ07_gp54 [Arthrobacter phage Urla]|uniref:Uncharacterized protein n=1 Tax=Arthrobacter phage Urla TaxID=2047867 RepID=A0A2H4P985_9CAUD|nr:hypothetical protein KDJ07_gp54 [Arthrobacter phage Urla]ATW58768.1 hypothetical protein PHIRE_URLA_54 [Arthrobacter phage Urla]
MAHVNTATVQGIEGNLVEVTKTSTHRDYVKVSIIENPLTGEQQVLSWHLTEAAANKYIASNEARKIRDYKHEGWTLKVLPVVNTLTGKDAPKTEAKTPAPKAQESKSPEGDGCKCGCGVQVTGKSAYRPGHDAKHVSNLVRATKEANTEQQGRIAGIASQTLSQPLFLKYMRAVGK